METFWINGVVLLIPSCWTVVMVDGDVFKRCYNHRSESEWRLISSLELPNDAR